MNTFPFPGHDLLVRDIVRADNCSLFDSQGNRYVDLESGVWCTSVGHGNPAVKEAMTKQLDSLGHVGFCYASPVVERAARSIQRILGHGQGRCTFLCSGSEAVEYGVRVMRSILPDKSIMTMGDSYFGAYGDAASRNRDDWFIFDWFGCRDCNHETCSDACPRWTSIPFETIGGFLFEPGSSSGLVRFPPKQLIRAITDTLHDNNGLIMVNEVTTGVGRTGEWFGYQHYGIQPDIAALGKGIGNGYPVSVSSLNSCVASHLGESPIPFGQSHLNDPLGATVAEAVIMEIEKKDLIDRARRISHHLLNGLQDIADHSPHVSAVRGRGLMAAMELGNNPDNSRTAKLHRELVRNGFICGLRPGTSLLRIDPALTVEEQDITQFLEVLRNLLKEF